MNFNEFSDIFMILSKYEATLGRTFPSIVFNKVSRQFKSAKVISIENGKVKLDDIILGASSSSIVIEFLENGTSDRYETAKLELSKSKTLDDLPITEVAGIGDTKSEILQIHGVKTVKDLIKLNLKVGEEISNSGLRFTDMMNTGLKLISKTRGRRLSYKEAFDLWLKIHDKLKSLGVDTVCAGSLRRKKFSIGDLDLITIVTDNTRYKVKQICKSIYDELLVEGDKKISGIIEDFQVDIRFIKEEEFGCHLLHATGSAEFNQQIRSLAKEKGYKLNEYYLFDYSKYKAIYFPDEISIFKYLGIDYVEPEKR